MPYGNLVSFLGWLAGGAGAMVAVAFLAERIPWFQKKSSQTKGLIILGASLVVGLGSYAVVTFVTPAVLAAIQPFFQVAAIIVVGWLASQWGHSFDPLTTTTAAQLVAGTPPPAAK
jgi:hypothetical protein